MEYWNAKKSACAMRFLYWDEVVLEREEEDDDFHEAFELSGDRNNWNLGEVLIDDV